MLELEGTNTYNMNCHSTWLFLSVGEYTHKVQKLAPELANGMKVSIGKDFKIFLYK